MRATVKGRVAVFHPQGFLDGNNAPSFLTIDDIKATEALNIDMLLVSLKKVIFFNKNGLDVFIRLLLSIRSQKHHISVGLCDYDSAKFKTIQTFYGSSLNFSLFRTEKIAELFVSTNKSDPKTVLLYNEDPSQRSAMAIELFDYGHNPIIAQSQKEFEEKKAKFRSLLCRNRRHLFRALWTKSGHPSYRKCHYLHHSQFLRCRNR
jgi:anti-anti-sigma regulatory factor